MTALACVSAFFLAFKAVAWNSVVVHEEGRSVHRLFFGRWLVRFSEEPVTLVDVLTSSFLGIAGLAAACAAFAISVRLETTTVCDFSRALVRRRSFHRLVAFGAIWLAADEMFLLHETLSANAPIPDPVVLAIYALGALAACGFGWRELVRRPSALRLLAVGAALHVSALWMDFVQERFAWLPEEPFEMLAAGFYALAFVVLAASTTEPEGSAAARRPEGQVAGDAGVLHGGDCVPSPSEPP